MNTTPFPVSSDHDSAQPSWQQLVVLVVDDSATNRVVIERQLKKLGCTVLSAVDGRAGLRVIEEGGVDLVLLDCQMPDISGYEVARQVREQASQTSATRARRLPIIAISGDTDAAHRQHCFDSGMDDILCKPIPPQALREALVFWCGMVSMGITGPESVVVDEALRVELSSLYRSTSLSDLATLEACVARFDLPMLQRWVHRMKGAALAIGAAQVVVSLDRLEAMSFPDAGASADDLEAVLEILRQQLHAF